MSAYYSTLSGWIIPVTRAMKALGIEPNSTLEKFKIDPAEVNNPEGRICVVSLGNLFEHCNALVPDRQFNIEVARHFHPSALHALGYAVQSAYSLHEALERVSKYKRVVSNCSNMETYEDGDELVVEFQVYRYPDSGRYVLSPDLIESFLATLVQVARDLVDGGLDPLRVQISVPQPRSNSESVSSFFNCPIEYNADRTAVVLDLAMAKQRALGNNPVMNQVHMELLNQFMSRVDKTNLTYLIENKILEDLPMGAPSQSDVAKQLGLSLRNLQRKLSEQGTCYKDILDSTRKRLTLNYIKQPHLSISEIGYLVGFSNVANFNRAFRRWVGCAPGEYRQNYLTESTLSEL
ncbi:AraC family transcriptional regulator [Enterovibrio nigricans]|uniref:AraC-type DNA-binding protein n=1 Tax=Enterovibrio nigricans DSM 22720 TaxID=1121868 RepID=A0A1T4VV33_9GAMM|nr:AraC family transcriptional regulator [Enterovibrio nigricans]PKF49241.1 AraC family transcriptional regulator [Enterovibrio nigricans]SKA68797.1 AraC-type DNA-binding protein [Enterovibrio nigricans DSM 22720]